ncbi:MAG: YihY/virulence factor BrkB family protein [Eubacteriales bacterium]|nr:YihY/virulence factor BrkB family protein [Eubacteriales bacterium]
MKLFHKEKAREMAENLKNMGTGRRIFTVGMRTIRRLQDPYYQGTAAEIGFYFLFAIVPVVTLMLQIVYRISAVREVYMQLIEASRGNTVIYNLLTAIQGTHTGGINLIFIIVALWSASKLEFSMIRIANYTYMCDGENGFLGYFKARARAIFTLIVLIITIMTCMMLLVYGNLAISLANTALGDTFHVSFHFMTSVLRWPLALFIFWLVIAVNYMMTPNETISLKETIPGSLFAAAAILVATIAYYIYFEYFSHLNLVYGSLAAIIALMMWFYWLGYILVVGMLINAVWFGRGEERYS